MYKAKIDFNDPSKKSFGLPEKWRNIIVDFLGIGRLSELETKFDVGKIEISEYSYYDGF